MKLIIVHICRISSKMLRLPSIQKKLDPAKLFKQILDNFADMKNAVLLLRSVYKVTFNIIDTIILIVRIFVYGLLISTGVNGWPSGVSSV